MIESIFTQSEIEGFALLYMTDTACPVCDVFWSVIEETAKMYESLTVKAVNKQTLPELAGQLLVFQFPTAILFYQGKEVRRFVGAFAFSDFHSHVVDFIERFGGN